MKHILLKIQFNVEAIIFRLMYTHIPNFKKCFKKMF